MVIIDCCGVDTWIIDQLSTFTYIYDDRVSRSAICVLLVQIVALMVCYKVTDTDYAQWNLFRQIIKISYSLILMICFRYSSIHSI